MMYQKALLFSDAAMASQILRAQHPRKVKGLGRKVANFSDKVWNAHREAIVRRGNLLKFTRPANPADGMWRVSLPGSPAGAAGMVSIKELLLRTGTREIVEASPMDRVWGIGFGAAKAGSERGKWGLNLLGKALVAVRDELREMEEGAGGAVGEAGAEKGEDEGEKEGEKDGEKAGEKKGEEDSQQVSEDAKADAGEQVGEQEGKRTPKRRKTEKQG